MTNQGSHLDVSALYSDIDAASATTLAKEAEMALAVLSSINQLLVNRRVGTPEMKERIGIIQCAALKFHFSMIPDKYDEHQALFDTALAYFMKVGTDG